MLAKKHDMLNRFSATIFKRVGMALERRGRDKYGRTLGRVYVSGNRITRSDVSAKSGRGSASRR